MLNLLASIGNQLALLQSLPAGANLDPKSNLDLRDWIIVFFGAAILITLGILIYRQNKRVGDYQSVEERPIGAEDTFRKLCEVNELSDSEAYLLRKVVFDLEVANPLLPFVDPSYLDTWANKEGDPNKAANAQRIRNKLFA